MATIDLTLDALKIPNINGTFPFGKKITQTELNHGGLSTTEVNSNVMLPFTQMRPKVCDENSDTSQVEYDAKVVFNAPAGATPSAGYTLTMGQGSYVGCTVTYTNLMEYACTVKQSDGTTTLFTIPAGKTMSAMWTGTAWRWTTSGTVSANDPTPVSSAAVHAAIGKIGLIMYPVGSVYMSFNSTNPGNIFGGTWEKLPDGVFIRNAGGNAETVGNTQAEGLPNIWGNLTDVYGGGYTNANGAFHIEGSAGKGGGSSSSNPQNLSFWANRCNGIYGSSDHVTPYNIAVYMWKRTA